MLRRPTSCIAATRAAYDGLASFGEQEALEGTVVTVNYDPMPAVRFDPVGSCIYCGAVDDLSDEHIIPFGMGGRWVLPASSCLGCAAITSAFERRLLQSGAWWPLRRALEIGSRRPRRQPNAFQATEKTLKGTRSITVSIGDHPLCMVLLRFEPPACLSGRPLPEGGELAVIARGIDVLPLRPLIGTNDSEIGWAGSLTQSRSVTFDVGLDAGDLVSCR